MAGDENREVARLREELQRERVASQAAEDRLARYVRELERSNADLDQFAYAASHDLQEPLRMVGQFSQLLGQHLTEGHPEAADDPDVRLYLAHLTQGADRARRLVNGLLAYSRVGRQAAYGMVPLGKALASAIEMLNGAVEEAGATITSDELPDVWADPDMLCRVFLNLATNAIRFAREGCPARIHVSAESDLDEVVVSVADNGVGIDPRHAERVFGIFQRLDTERPGTGIGLAICKKIVEKHGGRIWVESVPGSGATFRFSLLRSDPHSTGRA